MNKKHLMLAIGLVVTLVALWLSTRGVDWIEFRAAFQKFKLVWLIPGLAAFYYSMYLRAVRWGWLFEPHYHFKGYQLFRPLMIGFAFNSIFPARVGEFVRCVYVGKRQKTGFPTAFATVVAERMLDGVTLLAMLAIAFAVIPNLNPNFSVQWKDFVLNAEMLQKLEKKLVILSGILSLGVIIFMIPWTQLTLIRIINRFPIPERFKKMIERLIGQFAQGFHALKRPGAMVRIVLQSIVIWVLCAASNVAIAYGFGIQMSLAQAAALVALIGIFILIPAAPGYWGLYEAGGRFSLLAMGVVDDPALALAYTLVIHLVQYVPIVIIGLFFAWQSQVKPDEVAEEKGDVKQ